MHFADRLAEAVAASGNGVLVGLDPRVEQLPGALRARVQTGEGASAAEAYREFCCRVVDVVAPLVPAVKPQAAFFEELGPAGMAALADVVRYARNKGLLVIIDAKRGDIGSTAEAYARGFLGTESAWGGDALTVNPYLGVDSLEPFVTTAREQGAGVFVLVKTSNPGSGQFQDVLLSDEREPLYRRVAACVEQLAQANLGESGYGNVGAVVGATYPEQLVQLRADMPHAWLLIPGYGAQGGGARDVVAEFDARGRGALVSSSRAIIFAHARPGYRDRFGDARWQEAVAAATHEMIAELDAAFSDRKK